MKKIIYSVLLLSVFSCGGNAQNDEKTNETGQEALSENKNVIDPLSFDFTKSVDPIVLYESMKVYYGKEIQLIVFPTSYYEKEAFRDDLPCATKKDADENGIYLKFKEVPKGEFTKNTAYIVKGKIEQLSYSNTINFVDVEFIGEAKDSKISTFNPAAISEKVIYSSDDILKSMLSWGGKNVTVVGDYLSTTVSKSVDGKETYEIRVDLGVGNSYDYVVGCAFDQEIGDKLKPGMKNIKINGTLDSQLHFDRPYLMKSQIK
jgi:hypothetical protein